MGSLPVPQGWAIQGAAVGQRWLSASSLPCQQSSSVGPVVVVQAAQLGLPRSKVNKRKLRSCPPVRSMPAALCFRYRSWNDTGECATTSDGKINRGFVAETDAGVWAQFDWHGGRASRYLFLNRFS